LLNFVFLVFGSIIYHPIIMCIIFRETAALSVTSIHYSSLAVSVL